MIIILTFIAFTGLVALISWYKTKEENLSTKEGYFLAGRGLTGLVIAGSLEMTNLSTEQLVGQAGQSYSTNMGAMSWSVNASIALLALALIFLPKYLKAGITTIPEFLEVRFDRTTKQIISFLFLLGYMLTYLPTVLYSGALAFNQIFHLDQLFGITTYQSIAILCVAIGVIGSIYAIFGGLKAVAVSDTVNGVGLLIGGLLIPILSICILGNGSFLAGIQDSGERPASDDSVAGPVPRHAVQQPVLLVHQPVHHPAHAGSKESGAGTARRRIHRLPQAAGSVLHHHLRSAGLPLFRRRPGKQRSGIPVSDHHSCSELAARHHRSGSVRCDPVVL